MIHGKYLGQPVKIAVFENIDGGHQSLDVADGWIADHAEYLCVSNTIEVEFVAGARKDLAPKAVAKLNQCIQEVRAKAQREVEKYEARISDILALTHQPSEDDE